MSKGGRLMWETQKTIFFAHDVLNSIVEEPNYQGSEKTVLV
jgi:hypothetical protein